jgi:hypothetical protein
VAERGRAADVHPPGASDVPSGAIVAVQAVESPDGLGQCPEGVWYKTMRTRYMHRRGVRREGVSAARDWELANPGAR